jgi:TolB protein
VKSTPPDVFGQIYTIRPDGTDLRRVTHSPDHVNNQFPDFSPGGGRIAFDRRSFRPKVGGIFTIGIDGRGERRLTSPQGEVQDLEPAFSPSGEKLAFVRFRNSAFEILTMRADGSHVHRRTHGGPNKSSLLPDWQPLPR